MGQWRCVLGLLVCLNTRWAISAQSLDTTCDFSLIPEISSELIRRISKLPTSGYDVQSHIEVITFAHQPIPLFSRYISFEYEDGEALPISTPTFVHYSDVTIDQAVEAYCSVHFKKPTSTISKSQCIQTLSNNVKQTEELQKNNKRVISKTLEALKNNRLPANIDFADVAADVGDIQVCASGIERSDWRKALKLELNHQALPSLRTIALDAGADLEDHGYDTLFSMLYDHKTRLQPIRVLEIGLGGSAGLQSWRRFFPAAYLHTMELLLPKDCMPCHIAGGVLGWSGNSSDLEFLEEMASKVGGKFDLIIDDGGHIPSEQLNTWDYLFKHALKPDGQYVIVDIETSYWNSPGANVYGKPVNAGLGSKNSVIEAFKKLADGVNREFFDQNWSQSEPLHPCSARQVEHVTFAHNAVALKKVGTENRSHRSRVYGSRAYVQDYKYVSDRSEDYDEVNC